MDGGDTPWWISKYPYRDLPNGFAAPGLLRLELNGLLVLCSTIVVAWTGRTSGSGANARRAPRPAAAGQRRSLRLSSSDIIRINPPKGTTKWLDGCDPEVVFDPGTVSGFSEHTPRRVKLRTARLRFTRQELTPRDLANLMRAFCEGGTKGCEALVCAG